MSDENWRSKEELEVDLMIENETLASEVMLQGGFMHKNDAGDPEIEDAFLKNILAFEEADNGPQVPFRSLFPEEFDFPPVASMSPEEIAQKIDDIAAILSTHAIELSLSDELPDAVLYKWLTEEYIPNETIGAAGAAGFTWHIDGCGGACEECFQNEYARRDGKY